MKLRIRPIQYKAATLVLVCVLVGACSTPARDKGRKAFFRQDYATAQRYFEEMKDKDDKNFVLYNLEWGSAAFEAGNYYTAREAFSRAIDVILAGERDLEGVVSLVAHESAKLFKGDPFERIMANFYEGLIYYRWGDYYNARAAFRQALLADKASKEGYRDDFAITQYMIARCYYKIGQMDNLRIHLDMAREKYPDNPYFDSDMISEHNVVVVLQLGRAPQKIRTGPSGSISNYERAPYRENRARVSAGGNLVGNSSLAVDLLEQAQTFEFGTSDIAQTIKGTAKTGALVIASMQENPSPLLVIGALLFPAGADLRQWDLLPGELHLVSGALPPGNYTFGVEFFRNGTHIPELRQTWSQVPVFSDRDTLLVFRSGLRAAQDSIAYRGDVRYCNDFTGHVPGTEPFIMGGTCTCTPTHALLEAYHSDGFLLDHTVTSLRQLYADMGIKLALEEHRDCNNLCPWGPHILEGGKCMVPPTPATRHYQRLITGAFTPPEQKETSQ